MLEACAHRRSKQQLGLLDLVRSNVTFVFTKGTRLCRVFTLMYETEISLILRKYYKVLQISRRCKFEAAVFGTGESHRNFLIRADGKKFVLRLGMNKKSSGGLRAEFENLLCLPPNTGPKPHVFDESGLLLPKPFSILSYIEGRHIREWSNAHLTTHGRRLATLHKKQYPWFESPKRRVFDLAMRFRGMARECERFTRDDEFLALLFRDAGLVIQTHNALFLSRTSFSLIHGDLYADNILFRGPSVRYLDWELMTTGDPAEDLARFYCHNFAFDPWYIRLSEDQLKLMLDAYRLVREDETLDQRVRILNIHYHCGDLLYFKRKLARFSSRSSAFPRVHYEKASEGLALSLRQTLDRSLHA